MTPNQGKRCTAHLSKRSSCPWERGLIPWSPCQRSLCLKVRENSQQQRLRAWPRNHWHLYWVADVTWRICILELIKHGNDHTVQRHPRAIMVIRKMGLADFDFLGMSHVLERGVPHPKVFVCLSTGNSGWLPATACGTQVVVPGASVFATNEKQKRNWNQNDRSFFKRLILKRLIDWCCFYYSKRKSLVAMLEAPFARIFF